MSTASSSAANEFENTSDYDQYHATKKYGDNLNESDSESDNDSELPDQMASGAKQLFNRQKGDAKLQDFKIKKMIGRGTFGKVYLVEQVGTGNLYAMKCIRKDIIIENEQMENIQLEKDILF